ncbi:MAG: M50 family metallopeptidase [Candidatus Nanopelagicales bacterium]
MEIFGILFLIFIIMLSIGLHEIGHMVPAKKFGVKVTQYMIGFGPTLWSKTKGDTEYGVKAIPLGGFVRMIGMIPPAKEGAISKGPFAEVVNTARKQSEEEIGPGDENKVFYKLSVPKKLIVMVGGPFMNLVLAFVFFAASFTAIGIPAATNEIKQVISCLPTDVDVLGDCLDGTEASPALSAGLQAKDQIISYDNKNIENWEDLALAIQNSNEGNVDITVLRDGQELDLTANIVKVARPSTLENQSNNPATPYLGISPNIILDRQPISTVFAVLGEITVGTFRVIINFPDRVAQLFSSAFLGEERDQEGLVGIVGVTRVGGEIAAADIPALWRFATLLNLAGGLNMALFLFNLLPLLPLDGGHAAGAIYEGLRRQFAKLRGKQDPGPADTAKMLPFAYSVAILLIGLSMLLLYVDIVNPIRLGG